VTGLRDIAALPTPLRSHIAATVDGLIDEIHHRPAAASGWEALGYPVEAALTRADLARNLSAAGDPTANSATAHATSLCRDLGIVPLLTMSDERLAPASTGFTGHRPAGRT
jgi:hypothetical protein